MRCTAGHSTSKANSGRHLCRDQLLAWTLLFSRPAPRTIRYYFATTGEATVVRFALIGKDVGALDAGH